MKNPATAPVDKLAHLPRPSLFTGPPRKGRKGSAKAKKLVATIVCPYCRKRLDAHIKGSP